MKKLNTITLAALGVGIIVLVGKAIGLAEAGITIVLMRVGGLPMGAAAARAPLVLWASICLLAFAVLSIGSVIAEGKRYERSAQRQKIHQAPKKTVTASKRKVG